jgi:type IV pilus assembly protein PilC
MAQAKKSMSIELGGVSIAARALLAKHLAVMLKSGVTLTEALEVIHDSARGRLKSVLKGVKQSVETGRSLSSAFADYPKIFPVLFVQATYAGEKSGTLAENLENIAEELEKEKDLIRKIRGALVYPVVVLVAAFVLAMGLSFFVLPNIVPLFGGLKVELPLTTRILINFSGFIENYGAALFAGIIFTVFFLSWFLRLKIVHPFTHWILLKTPIIGRMMMASNMVRFNRTLGMLLKSGLTIDEALSITESALGNFYYKRALYSASQRISKGAKLSESLEENKQLFPLIVTRMIRIGEESGQFEETLFYLSDFYEADVDASTKTLSTTLEPILLLFIGLVVGGLALAIITPIYEITGNIRR